MAKQTKTPMIKTLAAQYARTQFGQVFDLVREGKARFVVERNGEPIGAIVSMEDLYDLLGKTLPKSEALAALQAHSRKRGLNLLSLDEVNKEITDAREGTARSRKRA